jgi:hypothetical protein
MVSPWAENGRTRRAVLAAVLVCVLAATGLAGVGVTLARAEQAVVTTSGECLRLRQDPALDGRILACLAAGTVVEASDEWAEADGHAWRQVYADGMTGWVAAVYLQRRALPEPEAPAVLPVPPPGGVTIGRAGTDSLLDLATAQSFEVSTVVVFDIAAQQFRMFNPEAAERLGTLAGTSLRPDDIVLVRRSSADYLAPISGSGSDSASTVGTPRQFAAPPRGGLTVGLAGVGDLDRLVAAQSFAVDMVATWDVSTQQWLTHRPDAPEFANSLRTGHIDPTTPVFLRRHLTAPDPAPPEPESPSPATGEPRTERITYYYCERGENPAWWGDGGGFCGAMANGQIVHTGAASCVSYRMGERFRIQGDPTERVYTCTDTGGAVHDGHRDIWFADSDTARRWWLEVGSRAVVIPVE